MKILVLGDVVSDIGCDFLRKKLPSFKRFAGIDFCIVNGENSARGNGITPDSADRLFMAGVDFITTGNHTFRRREIYDYLDEKENIIRPINYAPQNPGKGYDVVDLGYCKIGIINLIGSIGLDCNQSPFACIDGAIKEIKKQTDIIFVDFHAEATSEKKAMGFYLDGKVTALFGTHTHVLTADERVLKGGTGYITDVGMCGVVDSVLGVDTDIIIRYLSTGMPERFDPAKGACMLNGCIFTVDEKTGRCLDVERVCVE